MTEACVECIGSYNLPFVGVQFDPLLHHLQVHNPWSRIQMVFCWIMDWACYMAYLQQSTEENEKVKVIL